jgi:hypothetical protein
VLAGFFSALMAIDTRLNMGAAYFVNDFYRPYLVKGRSEQHYVNVSRVITVVQDADGADDVQARDGGTGKLLLGDAVSCRCSLSSRPLVRAPPR